MAMTREWWTRRALFGWGAIGAGGVVAACAATTRNPPQDARATSSTQAQAQAQAQASAQQASPAAAASDPGQVAAPAAEVVSATPATLVLIHGAWHRPGPTWNMLADELLRQGIPSVAVPLPSADPRGGQRPGLADDIAAVTAAIDAVDGPVVLVGHSYGGMVVSGAGGHSAVRGLVYLAAFCLAEGETVLDIAAVDPPPLIASAIRFGDDGLMTIDPSLANDVFYADVPTALAQSSIAALVASTAAIFTTPQGPPAWTAKRSWYVVCEQDQAIPVFREREMSARCDATIVLESSHSPFLSMPARVAEILGEVVRTLA